MTEKHWRVLQDEALEEMAAKVKQERLKPLTTNQARYMNMMRHSVVTIGTGPAGTGKTYMAVGFALQLLYENKVKKIVLTRPLVECDEELGFLPGTMMEKVMDAMRPCLDALQDFCSPAEYDKLLKEEKVQIVPLAKMRGSTFKDSFIILDEAQNATFRQLKMFLTRLGRSSKMVVVGDHTQSDLPYHGDNSLMSVIKSFRQNCHRNVGLVQLGREDIVRHELIRWMDERLSGNVDYNGEEKEFAQINCPECQENVWYDLEAEQYNDLIQCWKCHCLIELINDNTGNFEPIIIDSSECSGDEQVFDSHPVKP